MEPKVYSLGWNLEKRLVIDDHLLYYYDRDVSGDSYFAIFNDIEKTTIIKKKEAKSNSYVQIEDIQVEYKKIIDISNEGGRWEGDCLYGVPFGFGCLYNDSGVLIYSGFLLQGGRIGKGQQFYPDTQTIYYSGTYLNGLKHGWGTMYDKNGKKVYEGNWAFDDNKDFLLNNTNTNGKSNNLIHNLITELVVCDYSFENVKEVILDDYPDLEKIQIGRDCFKEANRFYVENCNKLKTIDIRSDSFNRCSSMFCFTPSALLKCKREGNVRICNCSSLLSLTIGQYSFGDYDGSFELKSKR